nr:MAG TPA: hypothetical protein [Caudoviricetes sp.]
MRMKQIFAIFLFHHVSSLVITYLLLYLKG